MRWNENRNQPTSICCNYHCNKCERLSAVYDWNSYHIQFKFKCTERWIQNIQWWQRESLVHSIQSDSLASKQSKAKQSAAHIPTTDMKEKQQQHMHIAHVSLSSSVSLRKSSACLILLEWNCSNYSNDMIENTAEFAHNKHSSEARVSVLSAVNGPSTFIEDWASKLLPWWNSRF